MITALENQKLCSKNCLKSQCEIKCSQSIIVRMPGNMSAALNQLFTRRHKDEEAKLPQKTWEFWKKIIFYILFAFLRLWTF